MKKFSLSAFVAAGLLAGGLSVTSANAADLGGNCCADLEERIAELEATTARKGNRKVSLTISGWVAEQVMWWDDGQESNVYVGGIGGTLASHVKFTGQATISPGWTAGYVLHIEASGNENLLQNQFNDNAGQINSGGPGGGAAPNGSVGLLQSYWFVKSDHLGKVSLGKQSQASDNTAILVDGSGSLVPANWVLFDINGFGVRNAQGNFTGTWGTYGACSGMGGAAGDCNGLTENVIRYDSPTFHGFSFSTSWGEDDMWDVAARYAGEFGGFKLAAAAAYTEATDAGLGATLTNETLEYFQVGAYAQHVPTGLFIYGAYGHIESDVATALGDEEADTYYVKAGIRQRWTPLGHTVLYGEYLNTEAENNTVQRFNAAGVAAGAPQLADTGLEMYGIGVVQEVDSAAMSLWLAYRHYEADIDAPAFNAIRRDLEDFDLVKFGALINF
jgi:predicted porin